MSLAVFERHILAGIEAAGESYLLPIVLDCGARFPEQPPELMLRITVASLCALLRGGQIEGFRDIELGEDAARRERLPAGELQRILRRGAVVWDGDGERWRWNSRAGGAGLVGLRIPGEPT